MARLKVGIIFGGCSEEHPVSVKSAQEVARSLDREHTRRSVSPRNRERGSERQ
jgi:D-alanine-D-alanine ligase-like ATP-grasp enzyme